MASPPQPSSGNAVAGGDHRTRQARGDARRQKILDAAVELFAESGFHAAGVAALADRVEMTAPGLLYYFGTKERLLREVVAERGREELAAMDERGGLTLRALRQLGYYNMAHATLTRLYVKLGAENLDDRDPLHDFFVERYSYARKLFQDVLLAEQERGAVRQDVDTAQLGAEVVATLMGLEIQWLTDPDGLDLGDAVKSYIDRLIAELAPGE